MRKNMQYTARFSDFFLLGSPTITYTQVYKLLLKPMRILSEGSLQSKISWFNFWFVTNPFSQMNARGDSSMLSSLLIYRLKTYYEK